MSATPADGCSAVGMTVTLGRLGGLVSIGDVIGGLKGGKKKSFEQRAQDMNNITRSKMILISQQQKLTCDEINGAELGG